MFELSRDYEERKFPSPSLNGITVYTLPECSKCDYVKKMLDDINKKDTSLFFDCESYITHSKDEFKRFIFKHMGYVPSDNKLYFPVVFYKGRYLKTYISILDYLD